MPKVAMRRRSSFPALAVAATSSTALVGLKSTATTDFLGIHSGNPVDFSGTQSRSAMDFGVGSSNLRGMGPRPPASKIAAAVVQGRGGDGVRRHSWHADAHEDKGSLESGRDSGSDSTSLSRRALLGSVFTTFLQGEEGLLAAEEGGFALSEDSAKVPESLALNEFVFGDDDESLSTPW
mmetsp:Transcript_61265/g.145860  ORF Transcript_61265/g.145860 Transcript_61265/m.145860 type:complete len:179 (+) Transcript_61265:82-618(+)|eukprot:CAMPEP_0178436122 /NCGR_PEP_ID=MMETSP0689_2-20121128/34278_1 /TAXON_ID=160604 /ORGANISM="Amphidinium massartii, Strain CS-259" /LENGTH=178 /DNA_ID=CAMNT_0020058211 /DNA_START=22 /DNA_END=558 /DNA_ORIENTATION=-